MSELRLNFAVGLGAALSVRALLPVIFPEYGDGTGGLDRYWHLTLPAITLGFGPAAPGRELTRTAVITELRQDDVTFARSRGLSTGQTPAGWCCATR